MVTKPRELGSEQEARDALTDLLADYGSEYAQLRRIDGWWRWRPEKNRLSRKATAEHRSLRDISQTPWLQMVVTTLAQTLYLDGVEMPVDMDGSRSKRFWAPWNNNRMGARQIGLHRSAIAYGSAYTAVSRGEDGSARIDCWSPMESLAVYRDPARDVFPQLFLTVCELGDESTLYEVWDAWNIWRFTSGSRQGPVGFAEVVEHDVRDGAGRPVCPVVRYTNQIDLQGRTPGEVEPYITVAKRLNKDDYDRMVAQHYNSWKVKTATNLDMSDLDEKEREEKKLKLEQGSMLFGGEGVQFGTLSETDLDNLVNSHQADVDELAAVSQTPATAFGKMVNVGDAGIEESRAGFYAKRNERRKTFGVSHLDTLRLCAAAEGRMDDAANMELTAVWADTDTRTISQAVDAWGKAHQMLGVPAEQLWDLLPNVTKAQADMWRAYAQEHPTADDIAVRAYQAQLDVVGPKETNYGVDPGGGGPDGQASA